MSKLRPWPADVALRRWQERALLTSNFLDRDDALIVATPGSGKTLLALMIAHLMLHNNIVERLVVVCPTDHLRRQWASAASRVGMDIDPLWSNADGVEADDFCGVVVTYQQVSYAPDLYRMNCGRHTLVIFDEVHHAADDLDWGNKLREAFEPAAFRLSLSGTPFRSDNNPIPFVTYEEGKSKANFIYGYADALADGVCRPVYFPSFEGRIRWLSCEGEEEDCSLLDPVSRGKAAERLRAALSPDGDWLRDVLREADAKLTEVRAEGHADAGGLVIAMDQEHAKKIGRMLREITGAEAWVAISESPDASDIIKSFAQGRARWIVAVRMISEGVDIPRLRVGVYATNVQSELFFRQAVGRFVRMIDGLDEQSASLYIPADPTLVRYAMEIKRERNHQLTQENMIREGSVPRNGGGGGARNSVFTPLSSELKPHDVIFDGVPFANEDLVRAEAVSRELGLRMPHTQVAALLRRGAAEVKGFAQPRTHPRTATKPAEMTKAERKQLLRKSVQMLANRLARRLGVEPREVHKEWIELSGPATSRATEEDLRRKRAWLIKRIKGANLDSQLVGRVERELNR
jgi:superfamily II DNA or RNA helicase